MSKVSVIIPNLFESHLQETVDNVEAMADGPIEVIVKDDTEAQGLRYLVNQAAQEATGEFIFKLDGHCIMTPHWDTIMKDTCVEPDDMAVARIQEIDEKSWTMNGKGFGMVKLNSDLNTIKCGDFTGEDGEHRVKETMASIGCGFMIRRHRFFELGRNWEALGRWGNLGAEWALKVWLSGGKLLVPCDVTCGHLSRKQYNTIAPGVHEKSRKLLGIVFSHGMGPQQCRPLDWLHDHFNPPE